ncbi:MAG: glycosyltransferase family 39 protein [Planctomycetes bacterium]|nr:glycosyltransferase family 39 protein [Planctomycetota bacterium]
MKPPVGLPILVCVLGSGLGLTSLWNEGPTLDEPVYLMAGTGYLRSGRFDLNPEHPPLWKELAAAPLLFMGTGNGPLDPWHPGNAWEAESIFRCARFALFLLLFPVTGWLVYTWSRELWGQWGGIFSLVLYAFCPNLLAHCRLVTPDFPATASFLAVCYAFWRYCTRPSLGRFACCALVLGLALACRFTVLLLVPSMVLILLIQAHRNAPCPALQPGKPFRGIPSAGRVFAIPALLLMASVPILALPYGLTGFSHYFTGLSRFMAHAGASGHDGFLFGRYSREGWWYYYPVALALKTPLPILISLLLCAVSRGWSGARPDGAEAFLWMPVAVLLLAASVNKVSIGVRLVLPILPLVYVGLGRLVTLPCWKQPLSKAAAACLGVWYITVSWSIHPNYLGYFNELVGREKGYHYLSDSNVDWGQDLPRLAAYLRETGREGILLAYFGLAPPDYYGIRWQYLPSNDPNKDGAWRAAWEQSGCFLQEGEPRLLAISVTLLKGVPFTDHTVYSWLEARLPAARIGSSIFVYDITGDADAAERLLKIYEAYGPRELAERERALIGAGARNDPIQPE